MLKKGDNSCQKTHNSGILQQIISGTQPMKRWRPVIDLSMLNQHFHVPTFMMETAETIRKSIRQGEWVTSIDLTDAYFHVPIHPQSQKYLRFQMKKGVFQFQALPFGVATAPLEFTRIVKEVKLIAQARNLRIHQYLDDWLLRSPTKDQCLKDSEKLVKLVQELGWLINFQKSELVPTQNLDFLGYHFDLHRGLVFPTQKKLDRLKVQTVSIRKSLVLTPTKLMSLIGTLASLEKTVPLGRLHMRPFQWYLRSNWKFPQSLDKNIPVTRNFLNYLKWWEDLQNLMAGPPSSCSQHFGVHRCLPKRLGSSLERNSPQWPLVKQGGSASHQRIGAESCSSGPKGVSGALTRSKRAHLFRQQYSSILSEQRRRHTFHRNVCSYLENSCIHKFQKNPDKGKTRTWIPKCHSRLSITKGQGHTDGVVTSPTDIQPNLQSLAHTNGRSICNSSKLQTSNLCISCPRQKGLENRCIEYLLGRPRRLCLLSSSHPATSNSKNNNIPMQDDSTGSRVARDAMVLGSGGSLDQGTPTAPSLEDTSETATFQQVPQQRGVPESTCVASGFQESNSGRFSSEVAERIKAPQRESSRKVYQSRWTIYGQWCTENKVDITSTAVPQVAEFLNYLFTVKNLKPATITGYRTAIADALGSQGEFISKSLELNRLIASFTRDRPKPNRSIPTWDLSLVLLGLTKPPFEPLSEAPLKWLTYKTVFLLALASGKRRSEIHAWTHSSVSSRRNWSEVTVSPSPAFLAKNQLASDGPDSIKPVVIPALTTMLDSSLVEDKSLCPVRALKVYLEKTKSMRKGKALLFVSLREGYSKDITRITISQWTKNTIQTCYQSSNTADQQVTQVRAHDVRAMAASLAFKGGISLEQVLSSCYWKSHNTFTNFYLKDICWENDDIFKLGPIVSAQHVVNN